MKLSAINEAIEGLNALEKSQKDAILKLIDLKIDNDMTQILNEIRLQFEGMDHRFDMLQKLVWGVLIALVVAIVGSVIRTLI